MTITTVDSFLDLVRRSGLVEKDQLNAVLAELQQGSGGAMPADTDSVAKKLVETGLLTAGNAIIYLKAAIRDFFWEIQASGSSRTGGMSSVYLAEHVLMQRRVAIKVLPKNRVEIHRILPASTARPGCRRTGSSQHCTSV